MSDARDMKDKRAVKDEEDNRMDLTSSWQVLRVRMNLTKETDTQDNVTDMSAKA